LEQGPVINQGSVILYNEELIDEKYVKVGRIKMSFGTESESDDHP